ncbi:hypothetical protein LIER_04703 [Lithospermum erythrorhizon]|uniref:Reverse transcriptase Ty1/copia-type domain-containing protein n=1 Tax=Lithospermum erythrorhizon TaxID=34254 RepID=A0AAV3NZK7_LITER
MMKEFKASMVKEFDMTDLGGMSHFLGIEVLQKKGGIFICQKQYADAVLKRFGMADCNPACTPIATGVKVNQDKAGKHVDETYYKKMVGSLMYLTSTRPDSMFATCLLSRYASCPTELHLQVAKRILSHGAIAWASKKQPIVTLSTTEAEFVAATSFVCQLIWMKRLLEALGHKDEDNTLINCDNSSTIKLSKNPVMHGRSKHIDVRYHFLRDLVKKGIVSLVYCGSEDQIADIMTKALKVELFLKQRAALGMINLNEVS